MTIQPGKTPLHSYLPGAAMAAEALDWEFIDASDIRVQDSTGAQLELGTDFSISGNSRTGSATITALGAVASGVIWHVYSDTPRTQQLALATSRRVDTAQFERELDRAQMAVREQDRDLARALLVPVGEPGLTLQTIADGELLQRAGSAVVGITPENFAAPAAAQAELASAFATALVTYTFGYIGIDDPLPPDGVGEGEGYVYTQDGRVYGALNVGGTGEVKFEILTTATPATALTVGANDASGGVKYTTVQGFITYLLSNAGASVIGFLQNGTGSVLRTVRSKLRDVVSPEDFGAVGDGVADDYTPLLKALQSGRIVDGNGRTYAIGTPLEPTNFVGFRNARVIWANTTIMATQNFMLTVLGRSRTLFDNLTFELGTVEDCGSANDSTRGGLKISTASEGVTFSDYVTVRNIRVSGYGNGTGVYIRSFRFSTISGITVHSRQVAASPDPTNDCQNGIDIGIGQSSTISNLVVRSLQTRLAGTLVKRYSRGILHFELKDCALSNYAIADVDQGVDFSGAITATLTEGNRGLSLSSMNATGCGTYGFKFANCAHDIACSGLVANAFGFVGFVISEPSGTSLDPTKNTGAITFSGCHAFNPSGSFSDDCYGFRVMSNGTTEPLGVKFIGCTVRNTTGNGKLFRGFQNDVVNTGANHNEIIGCSSVGHTDVASNGFTCLVANLPMSAPVGTRMTVSNSNSNTFNATVAGGGSNVVQVTFNGSNWKIG